jgi:hypothetical protein
MGISVTRQWSNDPDLQAQSEKFHALKEVGRGTSKLVKGALATVSSGLAMAGNVYFDYQVIPYLYTRPLVNEIDHWLNGAALTGVVLVNMGAVAYSYLAGVYGASQLKEGWNELKNARR